MKKNALKSLKSSLPAPRLQPILMPGTLVTQVLFCCCCLATRCDQRCQRSGSKSMSWKVALSAFPIKLWNLCSKIGFIVLNACIFFLIKCQVFRDIFSFLTMIPLHMGNYDCVHGFVTGFSITADYFEG